MDKKINKENERIVKLKLYNGLDGTVLERWTAVINNKNKNLGVRMILRLMEWYGIGIYDISQVNNKEIKEELEAQRELLKV